MPLVVPGLMSKGGGGKDKTADWQNALVGKTLGETSDETTFAKRDLPSKNRVLKEGDMATMDHDADRLNVHVDGEGRVVKVSHG